MREIVLDTETTGIDPADGHRIVEIGAVELFNHTPTGTIYHQYINPKRAMPAEAFAVHGLGDEFLSDQPVFEDIVDDFLSFLGDARMVIHNAAFDMRFINAELARVNRPALPAARAFDTLTLARKKFPGSPASLDALCRRFGVSNAAREKHGALLDSEILAEVYLELIGGRQPDFGLSVQARNTAQIDDSNWRPQRRETPLAPRLTDAEVTAHDQLVAKLGQGALWTRFS